MNKLQIFLGKKLLGLSDYQLNNLTEGTSREEEDIGWRRLSERDIKGLDMITRDRQLKICFKLYLVNILAKSMIDIINDYVFGNGFDFDVKGVDDKLSEEKIKQCRDVLNHFWKINRFDIKLKKKGTDLSINGMLILPVFVNKVNGEVRLGFIDPQNLDKVITNPMNVEDITHIKLKGTATANNKLTKTVIRLKEDPDKMFDADFGLLEGECFFFAINNVSNQPEGVSDILNSADMVDLFNEMAFAILGHAKEHYKVYQDVTIEDATQKEIDEWKLKNPILTEPGQRTVHNGKIKYQLLSPDIKANESAEILRTFKNLALMSKRLPEHWFTDGGNTNLATAVEQGSPPHKMMTERQLLWEFILTDILTFVLHQAFQKKEGFTLTREELELVQINIISPEIESKNLSTAAEGITKVVKILGDAKDRNWISDETAGKMFRSYCDLLGYDVTDEAEMQLIKNEIEKNLQKEEKEGEEEETEEPIDIEEETEA